MVGPLTNQQRSKEYYRIAYQCAEKQSYKPGCDHKCACCSLNVHLYIDDPKDATLIKTSAMIDFKNQDAILRSEDRRGLAVIIFVLLLFGLPTFFIGSCIHKHKTVAVVKPTQVSYAYESVPKHYDVPNKVKQTLYDVDKDGSINCVDKALLYYQYWGPDCRIIWHYSDKLNHLFVRIPSTDGRLIDIEPSRCFRDVNQNTMEAHFGKRYRLNSCMDVTKWYSDIKSGKFLWVFY